jgi:hypothetical protein
VSNCVTVFKNGAQNRELVHIKIPHPVTGDAATRWGSGIRGGSCYFRIISYLFQQDLNVISIISISSQDIIKVVQKKTCVNKPGFLANLWYFDCGWINWGDVTAGGFKGFGY